VILIRIVLNVRVKLSFLLLWLTALPLAAAQSEWSGFIASEVWGFAHAPLDQAQKRHNGALVFQPQYYRTWADGDQRLVFTGFMRLDGVDAERTHADIRELYWESIGDRWELCAGVRKIFWGVTESKHLVDVLNQTDLVDRPDGEEKLGQPMIEVALMRSWGTLHLFALPGFRQRLSPGANGRTVYQSGAEQRHIDWAARWSHYWGDFDFGLAHFYGTSRDPILSLRLDKNDNPVLAARYDLIHQTK
jgi:hypothetical protein